MSFHLVLNYLLSSLSKAVTGVVILANGLARSTSFLSLRLATRIIEIKDHKLVDFHGSYEDYLSSQMQPGKKVANAR